MLRGARSVFDKASRQEIGEVRRTDDVLDKLNRAIKSYLVAMDESSISDADKLRLEAIMTFTMHLEQAGDAVDKGLMALFGKGVKRELSLSAESQAKCVSKFLVDRM